MRLSKGSWPWLLCELIVIAVGPPGLATAHEVFTAYIQHQVRITVGARHVDVVLELTFFEEWSGRERAIMDADANGRIARAELDSYIRRITPRLGEQVRVVVGGHKLALALLYDPEVDLLGSEGVAPGHHRLRVCLFGSTPEVMHAGDEVVVENHLWPQTKALATLHVEGRDGCVLASERTRDPVFPPARPGDARLFKAKCVKPPLAQSTKPPVHPNGADARATRQNRVSYNQ